MKKHLCIFFTIFFIILVFGGCDSDIKLGRGEINEISNYQSIIPNYEDKLSEGYSMVNSNYSSEISLCIEKDNGDKLLIIYASPHLFYNENRDLVAIEDSLEELSELGEYKYITKNNDVKVCLSENILKNGIKVENKIISPDFTNNNEKFTYKYDFGELFTNYGIKGRYTSFFGNNKDGIIYKNSKEDMALTVYPTISGVENDIEISENKTHKIVFTFNSDSDDKLEITKAGYIVIRVKNDSIKAVIQQPIVRDSGATYNFSSYYEVSNKNEISLCLDSEFAQTALYPLKLSFFIDTKKNNQPDSQLYSLKKDLNSYLQNYAVLGNSKEFGNGEIYVRFQFWDRFNINQDNVQSIKFYTSPVFSKNGDYNVKAYKVLEDWCSLELNWVNRKETGELVSTSNLENGEICFDLTNSGRKWMYSDDMQRFGIVLKAENDDEYLIIKTNDNSINNARTEIIFK